MAKIQIKIRPGLREAVQEAAERVSIRHKEQPKRPFFLRLILPWILIQITRKDRQIIVYGKDFTWCKNLWTYNVFRVYEIVFGREDGIRAEISTFYDNGKTHAIAHSFEGQCALLETWIRNLSKARLKIELHALEPALVGPGGRIRAAKNYMFAIGFDDNTQNTQTGTAIQFTKVVTGSNPLLIGFGVDITGGSHDVLTGMKYNNVSLTFMQKNVNADVSNYGYILAGPATGSNTFETDVSSSTSWRARATSYSGCAQSGQPDNSSATVLSGQVRPQSASLTTVADNCWLVGACTCTVGGGSLSSTSPAGGIDRSGGADTMNVSDTNGPKTPAGSATITWTSNSGAGQNWDIILVSIAPNTSTAYTLTCAQGSYTLTGQALSLLQALKITLVQGAYTLTGQAINLNKGFGFSAGQGSYSLTGQAINFGVTLSMALDYGIYTLTGQAVTIGISVTMAAATGYYTLTGFALIFEGWLKRVKPARGTYTGRTKPSRGSWTPRTKPYR